MSGTAKADKKKGPRKNDPFKMLLDELKFVANELITVCELSNEEGKSETCMLTSLYLVEFVRRFRSPDMTRDRCRELSLTALHKMKRRQAPSELEALLEGGSDVPIPETERNIPSVPPEEEGGAGVEDAVGGDSSALQPPGDRPEEPGVPEPPVGNPAPPSVQDPNRVEHPSGGGEEPGPTTGGGAETLTILPAEDTADAPSDVPPLSPSPSKDSVVSREGPSDNSMGVPEGVLEGGNERMTDWAKANLGPAKKIILPDGTEKVVEDLETPDALKEIPSNVKGGAFSHVPTDVKLVTCPKCKMDILPFQRKCGACGWTKKG